MGKLWNSVLTYFKRGLVKGIIDWIVGILLGIVFVIIAAILFPNNTMTAVAFMLIGATPFIWTFDGWLMTLIVKHIK